MPDRPLLVFPSHSAFGRRPGSGRQPNVRIPSPTRQVSRIGPRIAQLEQQFNNRSVELRADPSGVEPEDVLVLETVGGVDEFSRAISRIPDLEWLADVDIQDIQPDEDFFRDEEGRQEEQLSGRLYLIMSNQRGMEEFRRLWATYESDPENAIFEHGQGRWKQIFNRLRDVRHWGVEDRIQDTGLQEDWQRRVQFGEEDVPFEVELWFRSNQIERQRSDSLVTNRIEELGGVVQYRSTIEEIQYHALLGRLPIRAVSEITQLQQTQFLRSSEIMFIRPVGQFSFPFPDQDSVPDPSLPEDNALPRESPVVALFDGFPLENHSWLAGRLLVDDPDGWETLCPAQERHHGTAMASLIVHGELDQPGRPLFRPIYVRPIMKPNPNDFVSPGSRVETIPEDILPLDLVHQAVVRMFVGEGGEPPVAPQVKIINLSVCDRYRQFDRFPSPWAKLLDYLSWEFKVLFVVSAGNHPENIEIDIPKQEFSASNGITPRIRSEILKSINRDARNRRLLSPAEGINVITVGALHFDSSSPALPNYIIDPYENGSMASPISSQGAGFRRSIKPELLFPGGRQLYQEKIASNNVNTVLEAVQPSATTGPGHKVAAPSFQPGILNGTYYRQGTSNSAALATRLGAELYELLEELRGEQNGNRLVPELDSVLIKALLVHSASWDTCRPLITQALEITSKEMIARLIGFGNTTPERLFECTEERATIVGCGTINNDEAHRFDFPLPPSLSAMNVWRRLTVTLAWLTPVNSSHRGYRAAQLWFDPYGSANSEGNTASALGLSRQAADWQAVRRGTVQHEIFEGSQAMPFSNDDATYLQINCRADAGKLNASIPYALAVSFEVAEGVSIPIYNEIRAKVVQRVEISPNA